MSGRVDSLLHCPKANKAGRSVLRQQQGYCRSPNLTCCSTPAARTALSLPASKQGSISSGRSSRGSFLPERPTALAYRTVDWQERVIAAQRIKRAPQQLLRSTERASRKHPTEGTFHKQVWALTQRALTHAPLLFPTCPEFQNRLWTQTETGVSTG
jgi:hypothetical protein